MFTAVLFMGCEKSKNEAEAAPESTAMVFKFKMNGVQYNLDDPTYTALAKRNGNTASTPESYSIFTQSTKVKDSFGIQIWTNIPLEKKTYTASASGSGVQATLRLGNWYSERNPKSLNVTITKLDAYTCSGTFSGVLLEGNIGSGQIANPREIIITEGVFENVQLIK